MVEGPIDDLDDPDEGNPDEGNPDEGKVLSPEELDITESEHVEQLEEGRFVVSSDARVPEQSGSGSQPQQAGGSSTKSETDAAPEPEPEPEPKPTQQPRQSGQPGQPQQSTNRKQTGLSLDDVHAWLRQSFTENPSRYGFDVTATFDGSVSQRRMASNDVVTIFESLLLWYAQQVDSDTPVEEILGILLVESSVPVRYPPQSLKGLVKSSDLGPEDTIADLLAAVNEEDGVKL